MIPLLMYHKVGAGDPRSIDKFLNVTTTNFRRQMMLLSRMGYEGISFAEAVERLSTGRPLPRRPVCVTFDDGFQNVYDNALPILRDLKWRATVFVPTAWVGRANQWDHELGKPVLPLMDWSELQDLQEQGWEIAGHTHTHSHLDRMDDSLSMADIVTGRDELNSSLRGRAMTFCYPYGGYNDRTVQMVKSAGFIGACTTKSGIAKRTDDPFLLPRVKVSYSDGIAGFIYRLRIRPLLP